MIPTADIIAWRTQHPWISNAQVEQDLIICRAVIELFSRPALRKLLAFRGGTALHKLFLKPAVRYSEEGNKISRTEFEQNLELKMKHPGFLSDLPPLLRPGIQYNMQEAYLMVKKELLSLLGTKGKTKR
jgi:hypothetical protein